MIVILKSQNKICLNLGSFLYRQTDEQGVRGGGSGRTRGQGLPAICPSLDSGHVWEPARCCSGGPEGGRMLGGGVEPAPVVDRRLPPRCSPSPAQLAEASSHSAVVLGPMQPGAPHLGTPESQY